MAGRGPAPKLKSERRNAHTPQRGEWITIHPLVKPVLKPAQRGWSPAARKMWAGWRKDPVPQVWTPADHAVAEQLAANWENMLWNHRMQTLDRLGLTPKGRRDLRYLIAGEPAADDPSKRPLAAVVVPFKPEGVKAS